MSLKTVVAVARILASRLMKIKAPEKTSDGCWCIIHLRGPAWEYAGFPPLSSHYL